VVEYGESLSEIAVYYGLSSYELAQSNGVYDLNRIYVGQHLCIPDKGHMMGGMGGPDNGYYDTYGPQDDGGKSMMKPASEQKSYDGRDDMQRNDMPRNDSKSDDRMYGDPEPERPAMKPDYSDDMGRDSQREEPMYKPDPMYKSDPMPDEKEYRHEPDREMPMPEPDRDGPGQRPENRDGMDGHDMGGPDGHDMGMGKPDGPKNGPRPTETWKGSYFADKWFGEFAFDRRDAEVNFNWGTDNPAGLPADRFSIRWEKYEFFKEGDYRFEAVADDGVRVLVDGQVIIDGWLIQPATEYKADIHVREGVHFLEIEYYEEAEDAQIHVFWHEKRPHDYRPDWP
jgi:LysM repeat protein